MVSVFNLFFKSSKFSYVNSARKNAIKIRGVIKWTHISENTCCKYTHRNHFTSFRYWQRTVCHKHFESNDLRDKVQVWKVLFLLSHTMYNMFLSSSFSSDDLANLTDVERLITRLDCVSVQTNTVRENWLILPKKLAWRKDADFSKGCKRPTTGCSLRHTR